MLFFGLCCGSGGAGPMPVMLGIHGGSYSHGDSSEERANLGKLDVLRCFRG